MEDTKHMLFQCHQAKLIWEDATIKRASSIDHAGQAVLEHLLCVENQTTTILGQTHTPELVEITCWYLWWERRQIADGEKVKEPVGTAMGIGAIYSNFTTENSPKAKRVTRGWSKPIKSFVKPNVDASFDADDLRGTTGAIIRDSQGKLSRGEQ
jgi:hypothetical protein